MYYFKICVVFSAFLVVEILGQHYEDKRCRCICPSPATVLNRSVTIDRRLYIAKVPPNQCNCIGVILPQMSDEIRGHEQEYCPRCECKYETRNSTVIMIVVVMFVWVIMVLLVYMAFLKCLHPLINKKKVKFYQEHGSEEARNLLLDAED